VALALASFEIVRSFGTEIEQLLRSGRISAVFANEDEARELTKYAEKTRTDEAESADRSKKKRKAQSGPMDSSPETAAEDALDVLQRWSKECVAVVTLGDKGCVARRWAPYSQTRVMCGAEEDIVAQDSTGEL